MINIVDGTNVETVAACLGPAYELLDVAGLRPCAEFLSRNARVVAVNNGCQSSEQKRDAYYVTYLAPSTFLIAQ